MNKARSFQWRPVLVSVLIVAGVLALVAVIIPFALRYFRPTVDVRLGSDTYKLWLADTEAERVQGLSGVPKLAANSGLLMDFKADGLWGIWMKEMNMPLDIVWLNKDKQVIYTLKNAQPESPAETIFRPNDVARYVLELPAGSLQQAALRTGMNVQFDTTRGGWFQ